MTNRQHLDWRGESVLVTGATGFVGARLVERLVALHADVTCLVRDDDPASTLFRGDAIERIAIASGRVEAFEQVRSVVVERDVRVVIHLAAQTIVGAARLDPVGTFESNIRGTYHVLEACRLYRPDMKAIVVASSDKAYGECEALPYTEFTPLAASNPYDVSKSCADLIAQTYALSYGLPLAIARCGNIFGPGDLHWTRLVPGVIRSLLRGVNPVIRSDGTLVRDYLHVDDAVDAYLLLADWAWANAAAHEPQRAFNFSSGCPLSVLEMTRLLQRACGRQDIEPTILNQATGEIAEQELDCTRARTVLHWKPRREMVPALQQTVEWYRGYLTSAAGAAGTEAKGAHSPEQHAARSRVKASA